MGKDAKANKPQVRGLKLHHFLGRHGEELGRPVWSPGGSMLATTSVDGTFRLWHRKSRAYSDPLPGRVGAILCAAWSPDGRQLALGGRDGYIQVVDVITNG